MSNIAAALTPGFDDNYGWISISEANAILPPGTWDELGFELLDEFVAEDGTIFILLQKQS